MYMMLWSSGHSNRNFSLDWWLLLFQSRLYHCLFINPYDLTFPVYFTLALLFFKSFSLRIGIGCRTAQRSRPWSSPVISCSPPTRVQLCHNIIHTSIGTVLELLFCPTQVIRWAVTHPEQCEREENTMRLFFHNPSSAWPSSI